MSIFSLPRGIHRNSDAAFKPNTMIDVLFDYDKFLGEEFSIHSKKVPTPTDPNDVIGIVGAGAAGFIAGILLRKAGYRVVIFEASDRVGGRMYSVYPDGKQANKNVFELGCMRFPPTSTLLFKLLKMYNIAIEANFPDPGSYKVNTTLYYQNTRIDWPGASEPGGHSLPNSILFKKIGFNFGCVMRKLLGDPNDLNAVGAGLLYKRWAEFQKNPSGKAALIKEWQELINRFKNISFYSAMLELTRQKDNIYYEGAPLPSDVTKDYAQTPWTESDMNAFGALGVGSGGFGSLYSINFLELLRIIANGWEDNQALIPSGIESLTDHLKQEFIDEKDKTGVIHAKVPCQFSTSSAQPYIYGYFQIQPSIQGDWFLIRHPAELNKEYRLRGVIVATTNNAAEMMNVSLLTDSEGKGNLIQEEQKVAVRNLSMMTSSKFFVKVSKRFWENSSFMPSNLQSDELPRGVYCLNYKDGDTGVVLISYTWGNDSIKLQGLNKEQRFRLMVNAIEKISPVFAADLTKYCIYSREVAPYNNYIDWQCSAPSQPANVSDNRAYGAFKLDLPGQEQMCHDAFFGFQSPKSNAPVILAGDSYSWAGGWIEGALTSGVNAACGVMKALNPEYLKPISPAVKQGIDPDQYVYGDVKS